MNFRSEPLKLCQLIVQRDAAYACVVELGKYSLVQFKDLNHQLTTFQRTYVREVRRCAEIERSLRYLENEVLEGGATDHIPNLDISNADVTPMRDIYVLEAKLFEFERDFRQFLANEAQLKRNYNDLKQSKCVYEKVEAFFKVHIENTAKTELESEQEEKNDLGMPLKPLLEHGHPETPWFVAGTVETQKRHSFERVLWRACRRTAFVRTAEIDADFQDPDTGKFTRKSVFIIFFNGSKLQDIINRVCDGFNAKQVPCPRTSKERQLALAEILIRLHDLDLVIQTTNKHKMELLRSVAFELPEWTRQIHLQKYIFHTLNCFTFDTSGNFFVAECWILEREMDTVLQILHRAVDRAGYTIRPIINVLETSEMHPTYNKTNKFTQIFQNIVDSYGIASYREINPAPFSIITFPFFFGIMFGDFGHGLLLFLAGITLILSEKRIIGMRIKEEIFNTFFAGRFIIMMMGVFSMYTGLIYNDTFSKSFNIFGSKWRNPFNHTELIGLQKMALSIRKKASLIFDPNDAFLGEEGPYLLGMDPIWNLADNRLNFINSMKMKMSVIFGITQMAFGLILSLLNASFFRSAINLWTIAVPSLIFLSSIFVYLCVLIILKWVFFSTRPSIVFGFLYPGSHCAPSLLIGLINMFMYKSRQEGFLKPNSTEEYPNCHLSTWYPEQATIEAILVGIAILCMPIMLFSKPIARVIREKTQPTGNKGRRETRKNRSKNISVRIKMDSEVAELITNTQSITNLKEVDSEKNPIKEDIIAYNAEDQMSLTDLSVHQAIHTIEFCLGCISHTSSYLRLWALSLAHAQLSEVLWHMVLMPSFHTSGTLAPLHIFISFFCFFILTVVILVIMEGLSAFLHVLRLHWVEFQSKFYEGAGKEFAPFSFTEALRKLCLESSVY
uniref:V-type proton ATPase subunit a n=1 Tax=Meloidogyne enterolobii TaxID=390850 RepID=A0A6V7VZR3_MELEN|nr:unnamed protein product [Meloidogyne enterolobii]